MSCGSDEVEKSMYTIVAEAGVSLDTGLLSKNIIILSLKVANDFAKAINLLVTLSGWPQNISLPCLVIDLVSKARGVYDSQRNASSLLVQFQFCILSAMMLDQRGFMFVMRTDGDRLDPDTFFEVSVRRIVGILSSKHFLSAQGIHEGCSTWRDQSIVS